MIELYGMSSPNVRKVGVMLEELGLDYVLHHVAVMTGFPGSQGQATRSSPMMVVRCIRRPEFSS